MIRTALVAALGILASGAVAAQGNPPAGRRAELLDLLRQDCGSCHGMTLKGRLGPALDAAALEPLAELPSALGRRHAPREGRRHRRCARKPVRLQPVRGGRNLGGGCLRAAPPAWPYNLFAMLHARSRGEVEARIAQIRALLGGALRACDVLYSRRILKKTGLRFT